MTNLSLIDLSSSTRNIKITIQSSDQLQGISKFTKLESLQIKTDDTYLPEEITQLADLKYVSIRGKNLAKIPEDIGALTNLRGLELIHCNLTYLPESFAQLTNLKTLNLGSNLFTNIPEAVFKLANLEMLAMWQNKLEHISLDEIQAKNLSQMYLEHNLIAELPKTFSLLNNLKFLNINDNKFKKFPTILYKLPNLKRLDIDENPITFSEDLSKLSAHTWIYLSKEQSESFINNVKILPPKAHVFRPGGLKQHGNVLSGGPEWIAKEGQWNSEIQNSSQVIS